MQSTLERPQNPKNLEPGEGPQAARVEAVRLTSSWRRGIILLTGLVAALVALVLAIAAIDGSAPRAPVQPAPVDPTVPTAEIAAITTLGDSYVVWWNTTPHSEGGREVQFSWDVGSGSEVSDITPYPTSGDLKPSRRPAGASQICAVPVGSPKPLDLRSVGCFDLPD